MDRFRDTTEFEVLHSPGVQVHANHEFFAPDEVIYDYDLLTRCSLYVRGFFGVDHLATLQGVQELPEFANTLHVDIHNAISGGVYDESSFEDTANRVINDALSNQDVSSPERVMGLVPRITDRNRGTVDG